MCLNRSVVQRNFIYLFFFKGKGRFSFLLLYSWGGLKCFERELKNSREQCQKPNKPNLGKEKKILNCFPPFFLRKGLPDPLPWQTFNGTIILLIISGSRIPTTSSQRRGGFLPKRAALPPSQLPPQHPDFGNTGTHSFHRTIFRDCPESTLHQIPKEIVQISQVQGL